MFADVEITSPEGKFVDWKDLLINNNFIMGEKYFAHDMTRTLRFIICMQNLLINGTNTLLLFITEPSLEEQNFARTTENKYSQLLISTITHDLKTPLMVLKENLSLVSNYVSDEGINYLNMLQTELQFYEYYIYDLVVFLKAIIGLQYN